MGDVGKRYIESLMGVKWAFPHSITLTSGGEFHANGMTLREHYAGLAMQGLAASGLRQELIVEEAINTADALIAALEAK